MKSLNNRLKHALLSRKVEVNHEQDWADIARVLDEKNKKGYVFSLWFLIPVAVIGLSMGAMVFSDQDTTSANSDPLAENFTSEHIYSSTTTSLSEGHKDSKQEIEIITNEKKTQPSLNIVEQIADEKNAPSPKTAITEQTQSPKDQSFFIRTDKTADSTAHIHQASSPSQTFHVFEGNSSIDHKINENEIFPPIEKSDRSESEVLASIKQNFKPLTYKKVFKNRPLSSIINPEKRSFFPEFSFSYGTGIVPVSNTYSDLSQGKVGETLSQRNHFYGLEVFFRVHKNWSVKTGFFDHTRKYKVNFIDGGDGTFYQYNYAVPLALQYNLNLKNWSPYISLGADLNFWVDFKFPGKQFSNITNLGVVNQVIVGGRLTPVFEAGSSFTIFRQKFSIASEVNLGTARTFQSRYGTFENKELVQETGQGFSNGTYYALKLKYHIDPQNLLRSIKTRSIKSGSRNSTEGKKYRNEIGAEIVNLSYYGSIYYQRFIVHRSRLRLGLKQGIMFIPEFTEKGFVSGPTDDIKPMGLFIPSSIMAYIGPERLSLQLGLGNLLQYGPLRYPIVNGRQMGIAHGQFLITGVRGKIGRMVLQGQFNLGFSAQDNYAIGSNVGFGIGYEF